MPSPDLTTYADLTVYDVDPQEVFDRALAAAADRLPGWTPREGNTEVVLLEALAVEVAELAFTANRVPGALTEILMQLYGVTREAGNPATASARFYLADQVGHTVPAGTELRLEVGADPAGWLVFTLDDDLVVDVGQSTGVGAITSTTSTGARNGTAAGARLEVLDVVPFVNRAELAATVADGAAEETTADWLARSTNVLRRLTQSLVRPVDFEARALEAWPAVARAAAVNNWDPDSGNPPGIDLGHVTVLVLGPDGAEVAEGTRDAIAADLEAKAAANLVVHVGTPGVVTVDVEATVRRFADTSAGAVEAAAAAAVEAYLDPDAWTFGADVFPNELVALLDGVAGVDLVVEVAAPAATVPVAADELVQAGTVDVTVVDP